MNWEGEEVSVTGGAGFIGSHLVEELINLGSKVRVADNLSRGKKKNIEPFLDEIEFMKTDLTEKENCLEATEGIDHVFHLAASVGGIQFIKRKNVGGLTPSVLMNTNMLEAARMNDVKRFLFASSACVYRQKTEKLNRFTEEDAIPANPHSTYGWAKILGEIGCWSYYEDYGIKTSMPRIFNAYGPRENLDPKWSHVIPSLIRKAILYPEVEFDMYGDGTQERGFMYVKDCVEGLIRSIEKKADGKAINLGKGDEVVSINELAEKIIEISGKDIKIEHGASGPEGTYKYCADMTKMKKELDWSPKTPLKEGLERTYKWAEEELN